MNEKILNELKGALEEEQKKLTEELKTIARPDEHVKGDWHASYTDMGDDWDENAQEVTEYATRLPLEHELELSLLEVEDALKKMAEGTYGHCEKCGLSIDIERLKANPSARTCATHVK